MLIGNSLPNLIIIRTAILGLRLIAPCSLIYCATLIAVRPPIVARSGWLIALTTWLAAESVFFLGAYVPLRWRLQRQSPAPDRLSKSDRHSLISRCFQLIPNGDWYVSKWFLGSPPRDVKRENVKDFLAWSLLDSESKSLTDSEDAELETYVTELEQRVGWKFDPGWAKVKSLRLAFDKVPTLHRPLLWYQIVSVVEFYTVVRLTFNGYHFRPNSLIEAFKSFPVRPHSLFGRHRSPSSKLSYWYRPHTSKRRSPILFIHGIGIGMYAYVDFLIDLQATNDGLDVEDVGVIAVETLSISSRICAPALSAAEMRYEIQKILHAHEWDEVVLAGHSYGSAIAASILRDPNFGISIKSAVLMDPISFMLHLPDVAFNFVRLPCDLTRDLCRKDLAHPFTQTRRKPSSASEWMLHYFTSTDLMISHTIARRFQWKDLILFKDNIPSTIPLTVTLSGQDIIVPAREVWRYLTGTELGDRADEDTEMKSADGQMKVLWFGKFNHADMFNSKGARRGIAAVLRQQSVEANGSVSLVDSRDPETHGSVSAKRRLHSKLTTESQIGR